MQLMYVSPKDKDHSTGVTNIETKMNSLGSDQIYNVCLSNVCRSIKKTDKNTHFSKILEPVFNNSLKSRQNSIE